MLGAATTKFYTPYMLQSSAIYNNIGAIQVLSNADGGGVSNFPEKSVTKV